MKVFFKKHHSKTFLWKFFLLSSLVSFKSTWDNKMSRVCCVDLKTKRLSTGWECWIRIKNFIFFTVWLSLHLIIFLEYFCHRNFLFLPVLHHLFFLHYSFPILYFFYLIDIDFIFVRRMKQWKASDENCNFVIFIVSGCCFVTFFTRKSALDAQNALHNIKTLSGVSFCTICFSSRSDNPCVLPIRTSRQVHGLVGVVLTVECNNPVTFRFIVCVAYFSIPPPGSSAEAFQSLEGLSEKSVKSN